MRSCLTCLHQVICRHWQPGNLPIGDWTANTIAQFARIQGGCCQFYTATRGEEDCALPPADDPWLIWSNEHAGWWRPNRAGYTPYLDHAGRYTLAEAIECSQSCDTTHGCPMEIPVRLDVAQALPMFKEEGQ